MCSQEYPPHDIYLKERRDDKLIIGCVFCDWEYEWPWESFITHFKFFLETHLNSLALHPEKYKQLYDEFVEMYLDDMEEVLFGGTKKEV